MDIFKHGSANHPKRVLYMPAGAFIFLKNSVLVFNNPAGAFFPPITPLWYLTTPQLQQQLGMQMIFNFYFWN